MLLILLCLAGVLPLCRSLDTESERGTPLLSSCQVDAIPGVKFRCPSVDSGYVPHGKHCHVKDMSSQTQSYIAMCSRGSWINVSKALRRRKRQLTGVFAVTGVTIGAVLGPVGAVVGGIIGGIAGFLCDLFCKGSSTPPNTTPSISWNKPKTSQYYANPGDTFAVVRWNSPTASDKEDGKISPKRIYGQPSNSKFTRGQHTITYQATDSRGLTAFSHYTFTVVVRMCKDALPDPSNGHVKCDNHERIAGTTCNYHCSKGYQINGNGQRKCQTNGKFSGQAPSCKIKTCTNSTQLYPSHGRPMCQPSILVYNTMCTTECDHGYALQPSDVSLTICQSNGQWSKVLSDCRDSEPPTILDCPSTQYVYADRGSATAVITWNIPTVKDNSGGTITATQTKGQSSGTTFNLGPMEIRYSATDPAGNTSPDCIFSVRVDQQICDPPNIIDQYIEIDCPNGFSYGSECYLSCRGSYPLIGSDRISCERNTTNPKEVYWDMGTQGIPYCKQNKCPDLVPPLHGALTCDTWIFGVQCMMHCNENYDIPAGTGAGALARFTGQFTCSTSSGKWGPVETVPGCTELRNPQISYLPGEMYYFTGSCNDTSTQQKIKENFITEMQNLQQNGWQGLCPNSNDCNVDNVNLKCGVARRRRRDLYKIRRTRQIQGATVLVTFNIVVKWERYGNTTTDTYNYLQSKAKSLGSLIEQKIQTGSLDVEGAEVDQSSFQTGRTVIKCETGRYPRYTTLTCASCALGSFYDDVLKECIECPKGSYRDNDDVITCIPCASGTSTASSGAINSTECVPTCAAGYYSLTGVYPCTPCSRFQYGPHEMATNCEECGAGLMTPALASTNESDCTVFDAVIKGGMFPHTLGQLHDGADNFTLALWIKIPSGHDASLQVRINNDIEVDIGRTINVTHNGAQQPTDVRLNVGSWQHVAVVSNSLSENIKVFVQGDVQFTSFILPIATESASDVLISSTGISEAGIHISGLLLTPASLDDDDINSLASTCYHVRSGTLTMDELKYTDSSSIELISPSICDAEDNCDPDPCHGHACIDDLDGFICRCGGGFTGDLCQITPNYCLNHQCENRAPCLNLLSNYSCLCTSGFKGMFCENEIVDGGWASWSNWSHCSQSCEGGNRTRQRECNNPYPDPEGAPCIGENMETELCNEEACPVCPPRPRSYGTFMDCNVTSDLTTCRVRCREGLWFTPGYTPLPEYKCGVETAYEWNGKPPSCSEIYIPDQLETVSRVSYGSEELCNNEQDMENALLVNSLDNIECVMTKTCYVDVSIEGCSASNRLIRSLSEVKVKAVITLQIPLEMEEINIFDNSSSTAASPTIMNFLHAISDLENSTKQLNTSREILRIEIDGEEYDALGVESHGEVECPDGRIQLEAVCTNCPQGTYNRDNNECTPCPYGTYQDAAGSVFCKECPHGSSTPFLGSTDITDCSTAVPTKEVTVNEDSKTGIIIGCVLGALFICAVIVGIAVWQFLRRKRRNQPKKPTLMQYHYKPCNS
ncbi:uncharacterized protein LOC117327254 [Pecten maximus]|uniref:uncharacterized protein LOC117327254 n=1 Tax=Pecten maximus TaxID=6579 RepID=UPI001458DAEF|nr:uncharacterized protein LOC117327254 [Pecten maximus]